MALHPTQLYEAAGLALLGALLLWMYLRPHAPGSVVGSYLVLYSTFRVLVEPFRDEGARPALVAGVLSTTQLVAFGLAALGLVLILTRRARTGRGRTRTT